MSFTATSNNVSSASTKGVGVGVITINVMNAEADVGGPTDAGFDASLDAGGNATPAASLTVTSTAQNVAVADVDVVAGVGAAFKFDAPTATSDISSAAVTYAGLGSNADVNVTGQVKIAAQLGSDGTAQGNCSMGRSCGCQSGTGSCSSAYGHGAGGGLIAGGVYSATADAEAPVTAELAGTVQSAGTLLIDANGATDAEAETTSLNIGAVSFSADNSDAEIFDTATVRAIVDTGAAATTTGTTADTCGSGPAASICTEATSADTANAYSDGATGGLIAGVGAQPYARVGAGTDASWDGSVGGGASFALIAAATTSADSVSNTLTIGLLGTGGGSAANACIGDYDSNKNCVGPTAPAGVTEAVVGSDAVLGDAPITGAVTVSATGANSATANTGSTSGGIIDINVTDPTATDLGATTAEILGDIGTTTPNPTGGLLGVAGAGSISVQAAGNDVTSSSVTSAGGGFVAVTASSANADTNPNVTAAFGSGHVTATGDVTLIASSRTDADSFSKSTQGGAVSVSALTTSSTDTPTVKATVNGGFVDSLTGTLTISATHGSPPVTYSDGKITNVATNPSNTLTLDGAVGITTGSTVVYEAPGEPDLQTNVDLDSIGGLIDSATYGVIVGCSNSANCTTLQLGDQFSFDHSTLHAGTPASCTGPTNSDGTINACVDPASATLTFQTPHNFHTGDTVTYTANGSPISALVGGAVTGLPDGTYTVVVVNPFQIRLANASTPTTAFTLQPTSASITGGSTFVASKGTFTGSGASFTDGEAVTYHAPQVTTFDGNLVGINLVSAMGPNNLPTFVVQLDNGNPPNVVYSGSNVIYVPANLYRPGDYVTYSCSPAPGQSTCSNVPGLTLGKTYKIEAVFGQIGDTFYGIQLHDPNDDSGMTPHPNSIVSVSNGGSGIQTLTPVTDAAGATLHKGIGNLTDGDTYYVHLVSGGRTSSSPPGRTAAAPRSRRTSPTPPTRATSRRTASRCRATGPGPRP